MNSLNDFCLEFYHCCIHTLLFQCKVYPEYLFEGRSFIGISVQQSRHPEVNKYIEDVFDNSKSLFLNKLVDRIVFVVESKEQKPIFHVNIKCQEFRDTVSDAEYRVVEEELRSALLKLMMIDGHVPKIPTDCNWKIMVVTKPSVNELENEVLGDALTTGKWMIDNNQTSEQVSLTQRVNHQTDPAAVPRPQFRALKSFRDEAINLSLFLHVFAP